MRILTTIITIKFQAICLKFQYPLMVEVVVILQTEENLINNKSLMQQQQIITLINIIMNTKINKIKVLINLNSFQVIYKSLNRLQQQTLQLSATPSQAKAQFHSKGTAVSALI